MSDDLRSELKDLTKELQQTNALLVGVVADNKHRDTTLDHHSREIDKIKDDFSEFKEDYKPTLDRARKDHESKDGYIRNLIWILIICLLLIITNSLSSGIIKLPFQGSNLTQQSKTN